MKLRSVICEMRIKKKRLARNRKPAGCHHFKLHKSQFELRSGPLSDTVEIQLMKPYLGESMKACLSPDSP